MTVVTTPTSEPKVQPESARRVRSASGGADGIFRLVLRGAGLAVLAITGTLLIAGVALILAVPLATEVALYISEYAPRLLRRAGINVIDLPRVAAWAGVPGAAGPV